MVQSRFVRGFPIMEASVDHPAEGYAADMGWLQVRYDIRDPGEEEQATMFDVPRSSPKPTYRMRRSACVRRSLTLRR